MRQAEENVLAILPRPAGASRQAWLFSEIRSAILDGRLRGGTRLPASRDLARQQKLSRGTVVEVYAQLAAEGYLVSRVGQGTFVACSLPTSEPGPKAKDKIPATPRSGLSRRGEVLARTPFTSGGGAFPAQVFQPHQPDLALFPFAQWNRIAARRARLAQRTLLCAGEEKGYLPLRRVIADRLRYSMHVDAYPEQIAIVGSVQQALDLCTRLLLDPGDQVWMEDPGYPGAHRVFESNGAKVVAIPVDSHGLKVAVGARSAPAARLAYVTANRHTPLGMPLALSRRLALLRWAEQAGAVVIEDDYDSEYRYSGRPLAALKSLDESGHVIYVGTFSKLLFPSLRLAYAVLPEWLVDPFGAALSVTCRHLSLLPQVVLHEFMAEGHFGRHIRRMRGVYSERAEFFREAVSSQLAGCLRVPAITAGLDAVAYLPDGADDQSVADALFKEGVAVCPVSRYGIAAKPTAGLVCGFAPFGSEEIDAGVQRIAAILG